LIYCAGAHEAAELEPLAELYVSEKEAAAAAVFNFCEQKLGCVFEAAQTIALIASADLPPKLDSDTPAPPKINVGELCALY
jgi:hypothetical protein